MVTPLTPAASTIATTANIIPQTFECRPTPAQLPAAVLPDELMIDWIGTPGGSTVSVYLPAVSSDAILELAGQLYGGRRITWIDGHTVRTDAVGLTYIPIPASLDGNYAGLLTLELPTGSPIGTRYQASVRQLSNFGTLDEATKVADLAAVRPSLRRVTGAFQISVPILAAEKLLPSEERNLAFFRWVLSTISPTDRWYPVMQRYVQQISLRVKAFGGDPTRIGPSPIGHVGPHRPAHRRPEPFPGPGHGLVGHTGKIERLIFDRFGDFEGFVLRIDDGQEKQFRSREERVAELARWAWQARIRTTVFAHEHEPHIAIRLDMHAQ
jgi:hypothetical protein